MNNNRIWVTPNNDLESETICKMLKRKKEKVIVTGQPWGASWEMLESSIFKQFKNMGFYVENEDIKELIGLDYNIADLSNKIDALYSQLNATKDDVEKEKIKGEISSLEAEKDRVTEARKLKASEMLKKMNIEKSEKAVYGVELQGNSRGATNVDHHIYGKDDRSNPLSSIEQVAKILGVELSLDEKFVSANDKGFIPEMEKLGAELGIEDQDLQEIIKNIRMRERQTQKITIEQEEQADEAVSKLGEIKEKQEYIQLDLPHSKTATITDRLYGKYENLLITSENGETNFFGTTEIINILNEKFPGGWSGGQLDKGQGFWGGYVNQDEIKKVVAEAIREKYMDKDSEEIVEK